MTPAQPLQRNIRIYPWYNAAVDAMFWLPVFFLYFNSKFSLAEVLRLEGLYYLFVVLLEVPSGFLSDRVGRRVTLLLGAGMLCGAYALFFAGTTFSVFVAAQALMAAGFAFRSGTNNAFLFETLKAAKRDEEYGEQEAKAGEMAFAAGAATGVPKRDGRGYVVDVHALRHTFGTNLSRAGVPLRIAQAAMRHATPELTANVYTDPQMLNVEEAVNALPELPQSLPPGFIPGGVIPNAIGDECSANDE